MTKPNPIPLYWTEFAESGNPNGKGLPYWPHFHRDHQVM